MFHGIFIKQKPKKDWKLVSITITHEETIKGMEKALEKAKTEGFEKAEVGFQNFDSMQYIPEYLKELKDDKFLFN